MVTIKRPCAVVASPHVWPRDLKAALRSAIVPGVLSRSRVDPPSRLSLVTISTPSASTVANALAS